MSENQIKPMPLRSAFLCFGIPTIGVIFIVYVVMPLLAVRGIPVFYNYLLVYATVPMLALIAASFYAYWREGNVMTWKAIKNRFRFNPMDGKAWLWTICLAVFMSLSVGLLSSSARWLASIGFLAPPAYWPTELNPALRGTASRGGIPSEFMGVPLAGNWWVLIVLIISLVIATFGEELWWRGYIFPRQELRHGKRTWVVHGLLWTAFHVFAPWNLIAILPGSLALSYVVQRLKNTWPAVIAHGLANGLLVMIMVFLGIMR
ncbi:CPBP family intramembrane metalloprotease [Candidatus Parcubacteria bacterium]|nr:MAG: CPBP family intramembrane metalloprotease [Candidatus Parcubacteria bacterium]